MADPRGFLTYRSRELPAERPVEVRIRDWKEIRDSRADGSALLKRQASRCMDCGVPFCHFSCPLGNLIPEWNDLTRRDRLPEAIERLHATNNFPDFTGRLCPAPCESGCVLGVNQEPVTIEQIEYSIVEAAWDAGLIEPRIPQFLTGRTVAVVGSGPAGLAAAQQLTRAGHTVAVYEKSDEPGGLLRYGIPGFKLEKRVVDRRLAQMRAEGTRFYTGVEVGADATARRSSSSATTRSSWPWGPRSHAICPSMAATWRGSTRPWTSSPRPRGASAGFRPTPPSTRTARTSSSSGEGTPGRTAWGPRCARARAR